MKKFHLLIFFTLDNKYKGWRGLLIISFGGEILGRFLVGHVQIWLDKWLGQECFATKLRENLSKFRIQGGYYC